MNDVKSFEQAVQRAKVPPIDLRFHNKNVIIILCL